MKRDKPTQSWQCSACTFINTILTATHCEICETPRRPSPTSRPTLLREGVKRDVSEEPAATPTATTKVTPAAGKRKAEPSSIESREKPDEPRAGRTLKKSRNLCAEAVLASADSPLVDEKLVKEDGDMVHVQRMLLCMTAVCRITVTGKPGQPGHKGSGFLASYQHKGQTYTCIMTNNHVVGSEEEAIRASAEFFDLKDSSTSVSVSLRPAILFITDEQLDFSLIACNRTQLRRWLKPLDLSECLGVSIGDGDVIHIIQHPGGGEKHMSMQKVTRIMDTRIAYLADTLPGSSGSPVFKNWKLIGLHNQGLSRLGLIQQRNSQPGPATVDRKASVSSSDPKQPRPYLVNTSPPDNSTPSQPPAAAPLELPVSIGGTSMRITNVGETITVYSLDNLDTSSWSLRKVRGLIEANRMAEGSLRVVHKAWVMGKFYVIKLVKSNVLEALSITSEEGFVRLLKMEVAMQLHVRALAEKWNSLGMPKNINVNPLCVVHLADRSPPVWGLMEPLMEGTYVKYNDNNGRVYPQDGRIRETPQTFSHFSYIVSGGEALVCDLQGVGDLFTDPQVHTDPRERCPVPGNRGLEGIRDFMASHLCTPLCHMVQQKIEASTKGA